MKQTLITISAIAAGLMLYKLLKKKYLLPEFHGGFETKHHAGNHHLTNAFSKAKKVAVANV